jgi:hypothetical protein
MPKTKKIDKYQLIEKEFLVDYIKNIKNFTQKYKELTDAYNELVEYCTFLENKLLGEK